MSELIRIFLALVCAVLLYMNIRITGIVIVLLILTALFYYIIKEKKLQEIVKNVALKNKDDLLENNVKLDVELHNEKVLTDSKWLEFILNQIINNSIKYKNDNVSSYIKISAREDLDKVFLSIYYV